MTKNTKETQKIAVLLAKELTSAPRPDASGRGGAIVIALQGDLGAGKTTFTQGFARALGVRENVLSPTFVLMKIYGLRPRIKDKSKKIKSEKKEFRHLIHIDCYRLASPRDTMHLGFKELLKDKDAIILIEWADRIKKIIPHDALWLKFSYGAKPYERCIMINGEGLTP